MLGVSRKRLELELLPPMIALDLARTLDLGEVVGMSGDVHQSSWELYCLVKTGTETPAFGPWNLRASFDGRPSGGEVAESNPPLGGRQRPGPEDVVRYLALEKA